MSARPQGRSRTRSSAQWSCGEPRTGAGPGGRHTRTAGDNVPVRQEAVDDAPAEEPEPLDDPDEPDEDPDAAAVLEDSDEADADEDDESDEDEALSFPPADSEPA